MPSLVTPYAYCDAVTQSLNWRVNVFQRVSGPIMSVRQVSLACSNAT